MLHQSVCGQSCGIKLPLQKAACKDLLLLKRLHLLALSLEAMGYCHGLNRERGDATEPLQFLLPLELLQIPVALMISIWAAQQKTT